MNPAKSQITHEDYIKDRVDDQLNYYQCAANTAKLKYNWMQSLIIILGLLVPVIVNLPFEWELNGQVVNVTGWIQLIVTVFSLSLAILTGLLNFKKYGELWLSFRMTEELIKHQKFLFLSRSGKYAGEDSFNEFVQTIESLISSEHNKFHTLIQEASRPREEKQAVE